MAPKKSASSAPGFFGRHKAIGLYVPNLIGYARLAAVVYGFAVAWRSPVQCIVFYFV